GIMNQLYDVMYEFNFSLPPDYALVIRALGSLEGTAKVLDPDFKVIESAYPFVIGRLIADPSPDMRRILRELVIRNNGSIRWNRLERLVAAISEQASELTGDPNPEKFSSPSVWKLFDMHAVVDSTEDLLLFILSEKGHRVRLFLLRDIVEAADVFLQDEVIDCALNWKPQDQRILLFEVVDGNVGRSTGILYLEGQSGKAEVVTYRMGVAEVGGLEKDESLGVSLVANSLYPVLIVLSNLEPKPLHDNAEG
ncbi:putative aarF domain-containing protein kinase, partial [Trifolium pratense]